MTTPRPAIHAARGTTLTARSWQTEAPLRMLMNNLDPEVAERPEDLVVYGGTGRAARSWAAYDAIVATLTTLADDETLLVQSGKPVGVFRTHAWAPRVLIANSNLVGDWANWPEFRRLEALGLTMYGQMTAGSWIYIGTQGILQGTYETFAAVARLRFGGTLAGTLTLTGGAGGMGGAQPLAVTMNEGVVLIVDVDEARLARRVKHGYLDDYTTDLDEAVATVAGRQGAAARAVRRRGRQRRDGLRRPARAGRRHRHRHRPDQRPRPAQLSARGHRASPTGRRGGGRRPGGLHRAGAGVDGQAGPAMVGFADAGAEVFDYGNSIREEARLGGFDRAFAFPGFVPAYIRPLFCEGKGPFRWVALSGDPADIAKTDRAILELFPDDEPLHRWITQAGRAGALRGPAGPDLLARLPGAAPRRPPVQRDGRLRGAVGPDRDRPRPPRLRARSPRPTGRPRRWPTAPTRSPTGRCSTPCSTPPRAPPGCRCTTAAESASAARSTPAR